MDIYDDIANELSGDGMIIIDGGTSRSSLLAVTGPGDEPFDRIGFLISGPRPLLRKLKRSSEIELALENGPIVALRCEGGRRHPVGKGGEKPD